MCAAQQGMVILGGPSCVGKGPLYEALCRFYPQLAQRLQKLVLFTSRAPRPGEVDGVDYHFRSREDIEALRGRPGYVVLEVRGDVQALDLEQVRQVLQQGRSPFFEGNPFVPVQLWQHPETRDLPRVSVFLSPLSREEILELTAPERRVNLQDFVTEVMRRKLLRRTQRQKGLLSLKELSDIETRAQSAYREMQLAWQFDYVIPNHDGEDSENWQQFYYPLGDARRALATFAAILSGGPAPGAEHWEAHLLP